MQDCCNIVYLVLQEMVDIGTKRLAKLAQQWDKHRQPLVDEIRELEESANAGLVGGLSLCSEIFC